MPARRRARVRAGRWRSAIAVWTFLLGNAAGLVWLWWHGGNVTNVHTTGEALTSAARLTGLVSAYLALDPGRAPRPAAVPRAPRRLRPADRLAPVERARVPRSRARACRPLDLGLLADGSPVDRERDLDDDLGRHLSGDDHRDGRHVPADRRRRLLDRRRASPAPLRVVVCRSSDGVRRDRARLVPPDPDRERARARPRRGRLLDVALHRDARACSSPSGSACRCSTRSAFACESPTSWRRARASCRCACRARARAAEGRAGPVLPLAVPRAR